MAAHFATSSDYFERTTALLPPSGNSTVMVWMLLPTVATAPAYQAAYTITDESQFAITGAGNGPSFFTVAGDQTAFFTASSFLTVSGSTGNDGVYTLAATAFSAGQTIVGVLESIPNPVAGGTLDVRFNNFVGLTGDSGNRTIDVNTTVISTTPPADGVWVNYAWVQSATHQIFFLNGQRISTFVVLDRSALTVGHEYTGNDNAGGSGNVTVAYMRQWTTALTAEQITSELQLETAGITANLWMDCSFESNAVDTSGLGHSWTTAGSVTYVAQPSFPTNSSAATATAFSTLPQTITQDFGDGLYGWYSYTGHASEVMAGFWAHADIPADTLTTTVYESDGTTPFLDIEGVNVPLQMPQSEGTTIYFFVLSDDVAPTTDVTISMVPGPTSAALVGALFVNDDTTGFLTGVIDPATGYQVLRFFPFAITTSEKGGDVLADGTMLIASDDDSTFRVYDGQLALVTTVIGLTSDLGSIVRTCLGAQVWYVGAQDGPHVISRVDATGTVTDDWTIPKEPNAVAASNDETIIYVAQVDTTYPLKQWNPNTDSYDADLVAAVAGYKILDLLVLGDDTIVALYSKISGPADLFVRWYDPAGATLQTFAIGHADPGEASLFHALDDPDSFWVRVHNNTGLSQPDGTGTIYNILAADASVVSSNTQVSYEAGVYQGAATASPLARFGLSTSCPSFLLREAILPPAPGPIGDPVATAIRRERIFRHLSDEQQWIFYQWLQIDAEAGVGLSDGQGSDPQVILQWSDDGGHTWSNEHLLPLGKQGEYSRRAILKQPLGRSRDRVFKVAYSDPTAFTLLNAYFGAEKATS